MNFMNSKHHKSQTIRARTLKYYISHVVFFFIVFFYKLLELVGGGSVINRADPVYFLSGLVKRSTSLGFYQVLLLARKD